MVDDFSQTIYEEYGNSTNFVKIIWEDYFGVQQSLVQKPESPVMNFIIPNMKPAFELTLSGNEEIDNSRDK